VTLCLKAGTAESHDTSFARQQLSKHIPVATYMYATTDELLDALFSVWSVPWLYNKDQHATQREP
jgi:hypothetical protein